MNDERLRQQLAAQDRTVSYRASASSDLADVRSRIGSLPEGQPCTAGIGHVNIDALPNTTTVRAYSGVNTAGNGLVGRGGQNFESSSQPNRNGDSFNRNVDADYKILDNLADQSSNNRNARGTVDIVIDNSSICDSYQSFIQQFQQRYPNVQVNVIRVPQRPTPPHVPTPARPVAPPPVTPRG